MTAGFALEEIDRLLTTTRVVRRRLDLTRPVGRDIVLDCVRVATQAPSGGNSQRWHWVLLDNRALLRQVAALYKPAYYAHMACRTSAMTGPASAALQAIMRSSDYLADHLHDVPMAAIPCVLGRLSPDPSPAECAQFYGSILPAVWSFMLALRSRGLASALTTVHLYREADMAALLGLPSGVTQIALIPIAHPVGNSFKPGRRRPVDEVTSWNAWPEADAPSRRTGE